MEIFYWSCAVTWANERVLFRNLFTETDSTGGILIGYMTESLQIIVSLDNVGISNFRHLFDLIMSIFGVPNKLNKLVLSSSDQNSITLSNLSLLIDELVNKFVGKSQLIALWTFFDIHWKDIFWIFIVTKISF